MKFAIVVPVYNVEQYLCQCVDSILAQTYSDFVLLLVDDGSTDGSKSICDAYREKDGRIVVIHKENGGLSDARNAGIDYVLSNLQDKAEYLCFVDSDDYIVPTMLETISKKIADYPGDIVCFNIGEFYEGVQNAKPYRKLALSPCEIRDYEKRFDMILPPEDLGDYAVNKAYKIALFDGVRYPKGRLFEDVFTTYKLFDKARAISVIDECLYVYRRRLGSITKSSNVLKKLDDFLDATLEKGRYISEKVPSKKESCDSALLGVIGLYISSVSKSNIKLEKCKEKKLQSLIRECSYLLNDAEYRKKQLHYCRICQKYLRNPKTAIAYLRRVECQSQLRGWYLDLKIKVSGKLKQLCSK